MARSRKSSGGLLDRPIYKYTAAVVGLLATVTGLIVGAKNLLTKNPPQPVERNTELIIDRSKGMDEPWGDQKTKKIDLAREAARAFAVTVGKGENLALRQFGGPCAGPNTDLVVPFGKNNAKEVQDQVPGRTRGESATLNSAINEAIGDFGEQARFGGDKIIKRILVITGSADACQDRNLRAAIREKLEETAKTNNVRLDFGYIGLGMDLIQQQNLKDLADITGGTAAFPARPEDVTTIVEQIFSHPRPPATAPPAEVTGKAPGEPDKVEVRKDTRALQDSIGIGEKHLNDAMNELEKGDLAAAQKSLAAARGDAARSLNAFSVLGQGQRPQQFPELYQAVSRCWDIHRRLLDVAAKMIVQFQVKDSKAYEISTANYTRLAAEFERSKNEINAALARP